MSYDLIENTLIRVGEQLSDRLSPSLGYARMSSSNSECYRNRAVDCGPVCGLEPPHASVEQR